VVLVLVLIVTCLVQCHPSSEGDPIHHPWFIIMVVVVLVVLVVVVVLD